MKVQFYASFKKLMMAALFTSVTSRSERVAIQPDYYKTAESTRSATGSAGRIVARLLTSSLRSALLLVVATGILLYGAEAAGAQTTITPEPESRFWIEGTRSEERRVGKGWRSRRGKEQNRKQRKRTRE